MISAARYCWWRTVLGTRVDREIAFAAVDALDALAQAQFEFVMLGALAIVLQGFIARGLLADANQRQVADLEQFGRGEENHVHRVVVQGVAKGAFVHYQDAHAGALGFDGAGESRGAGADAEDVVRSHVTHGV